jgi:hypothetical protein
MPKQLGNVQAEFLTGAARFHDLLYTAVTHMPFVEEEIPHSFFVSNDRGVWRDCGQVTWKCAGMTIVKSPEEKMLAISEDGDVYTYVGGVTTTESIEPRPVCLRGVTAVEGVAIAYGMRRQVYERIGEGVWRAISAPDLVAREVGGFEALCGFSRSEMYAVGWRGEIWSVGGVEWTKLSSPVNVILTGATTHTDGSVYACGQNGMLIKGRNSVWSVVAAGETTEDFWGILSFRGKIYVASFSTLYELDGQKLIPVDLSEAAATTFHTLTAAEDVMWSIGGEDILSFDGAKWQKRL